MGDPPLPRSWIERLLGVDRDEAPAVVSVAGAALALAWAWTGVSLARQQKSLADQGEPIGG